MSPFMASTHRAIFPIDADSLIHFSSPDMLYVPYLCPHHCYPGEFQADKDFVCVSSADTTGPTVVVRYKVYNIHYMKDPTTNQLIISPTRALKNNVLRKHLELRTRSGE